MKARLLRIRFKIDKYARAREIVDEGLVPALRAQPGFVRGAMLADRATGDAISIVIWDSEASLNDWENGDTLRTQLSRLLEVVEAPPAREIYDIAYRIPIEGNPTSARTIETAVKPGAGAAVASVYADIVEHSLRDQPGFQAALLLVDSAGGRGISVTAWDSEAARQASEAGGAVSTNLAKIAEHFDGSPTIRSWDLIPLR